MKRCIVFLGQVLESKLRTYTMSFPIVLAKSVIYSISFMFVDLSDKGRFFLMFKIKRSLDRESFRHLHTNLGETFL